MFTCPVAVMGQAAGEMHRRELGPVAGCRPLPNHMYHSTLAKQLRSPNQACHSIKILAMTPVVVAAHQPMLALAASVLARARAQ